MKSSRQLFSFFNPRLRTVEGGNFETWKAKNEKGPLLLRFEVACDGTNKNTSLRFDADIGCGTANELRKCVDLVQASLSIPLRLVTGDTDCPPGDVPPPGVGGDRLTAAVGL